MSTFEKNSKKPPVASLAGEDTLPETTRTFTLPAALAAIPLTAETAAWMVLTLAAFLTRLMNLSARVMSHDESLHVYYSWFLSQGSGYQHNPMMHGPFLFEATALMNALFGANDFTSRLVPALLGIGIVIGIPLLLRPWLGRLGALAASVLFLVSPYLLYYSRYNRHEVQVIAWGLLASFAILSYLRKQEEKYLLLLAGALGLMLSTMEISFFYLAIFAAYIVLRILIRYGRNWRAIRGSAEWDLLVSIATLGAFFSSAIALLLLNPLWTSVTGAPFVDLQVLSTYGIEWSNSMYGARLWGLMIVFWAAATVVGMLWDWRRWSRMAAIFLFIAVTLYTTFFTNPEGIGTGFIGSLGYWLSQHSVERGSQPWYYYLIVFPIYEYLPLLAGLASMIAFAAWRKGLPELARTFVPFAALWAVVLLVGLSIAGEKMPWLSTHITVPFILLAAWLAGQVMERLLTPAEGRSEGMNWGAFAGWVVLLALLVMTMRTSFMVNYINYDYTTEFIGYAHGAPGVKWTLDTVGNIAQQSGQGNAMVVAYDSDVSWPMTWYLRDYPGFFGNQPNRGAVANASVVVVSSKNWQKTEAYLGRDYNRYEVIRMWWPMEDYKGLSWERVRNALTDSAMRSALWDIFWSRDYRKYAELTGQAESLNPPIRWSLEDRMRVYVRKDLAGLGVTPELAAGQMEDIAQEEVDAYVGKEIQVSPLNIVAPAGLNSPRGVAAAPDGTLYIADSGNSRILRLDTQGQILHQWGSRTQDGQVPPAPGTFNEPWGLAVDEQGNLYVADTWNHRIQKFNPEGQFLLEWGVGGLAADGPDHFWGPRDVAIGPDGSVYVTDTGNHRVVVFDSEGQFQSQFAAAGEAMLDEPVGIAVGPDGRVYVADTWNRRVAVFSADGRFERSWPVSGWFSTSIDNKPYISVSNNGLVYITDPEGYRVVIFDSQGTPLGVFGFYGEEANAFAMPNGIYIDKQGNVIVADAGNQRIAVYPGFEP